VSTQGPRPIRLAGFVLIGVAVVSVGLGVFALTSNGSGQAQAGRPPVTGTPSPPPPTTTTVTTAKPPPTTTTKSHPTTTTTTTTPVGPTTTVVPPPTTPANPDGGTGTGKTLMQTMDLRVYNNSKIKDLASTAADEFRGAGFNVVEVGNYSQGIIPTSTVYYSSAPGEKEVATELASEFNMKVAPRFTGIAYASPGVIAIICKDFQTGK
jgi:LytR cell envelope-related transcriptional attenuator